MHAIRGRGLMINGVSIQCCRVEAGHVVDSRGEPTCKLPNVEKCSDHLCRP